MQAAVMVPGPTGGVWDVREVQRPVVGPGQVLVRVHASSVNRAEFRRLYAMKAEPGKPAPEARTGGGDAAGEVVEVGAGVSGIKEGDRVMARCVGGFAEFALIDAREVMPAPAALSWDEAACVPVVFVVVHDGLFASGQLHPGETLLVTAAPSGVGTAALALGKYLGARVIGNLALARKAGPAEIARARYRRRDRGRGHARGGLGRCRSGRDRHGRRQYRRRCAHAVSQGAQRRRPVLHDRADERRPYGRVHIDRFAEHRLHLYGVSNRLRNAAQRAESAKRFLADLLPALSDGRVRPILDRGFALDDIAAAQAHVEADRHVGKVVIRP